MFEQLASILDIFSGASDIFCFSMQFIFLDIVFILFNVCLVIELFCFRSGFHYIDCCRKRAMCF